jgi:hypothetical protein
MPTGGYNRSQGEVSRGECETQCVAKLWTVEKSADQPKYTQGLQLVDIHLENPAEEVSVVNLII